ncbi:unnamed protein product [Jaminaea pallidilutea]
MSRVTVRSGSNRTAGNAPVNSVSALHIASIESLSELFDSQRKHLLLYEVFARSASDFALSQWPLPALFGLRDFDDSQPRLGSRGPNSDFRPASLASESRPDPLRNKRPKTFVIHNRDATSYPSHLPTRSTARLLTTAPRASVFPPSPLNTPSLTSTPLDCGQHNRLPYFAHGHRTVNSLSAFRSFSRASLPSLSLRLALKPNHSFLGPTDYDSSIDKDPLRSPFDT